VNLELIGSVFVASIGSGLLPFLNAEVILGAAVVASPSDLWPLTIASSIGQMVSKALLYALARWVPDRLPARARKAMDKASSRVEKVRAGGWGLVFVSSLTGFPPFYIVSLAAGVVKLPLAGFLVGGTAGRIIRFALIAYGTVAIGEAVTG